MPNPTAADYMPCCSSAHAATTGQTASKGRCFACCNDGLGLVLDLTAINGGPSVGTYEANDGTFLEIVRVSMVPNPQFIKFGPTANPAGATYELRLPRDTCCEQAVGVAYCIAYNSSMVETSRGLQCITVSVRSTAISIRIGSWYWFYKSMASESKRGKVCAKPRAWHTLGGNEAFNPLSLETGETLRCKAWSQEDTAYEVVSDSACKNRCGFEIDVTVTVSGLAGVSFYGGADEFTIVDDEFSVTFTAANSNACPLSFNTIADTGRVVLELSHPTLTGHCLWIGLQLEFDQDTGAFFLRADVDEADTGYGIVTDDCADPEGGITDLFLSLERMDLYPVTCGANGITGTGTMDLRDNTDTIVGTADVSITVN